MPVVFDESSDVESTPTGLRIPTPAPASLRDEAQSLFDQAKLGLEKDFPDIKFGKRTRINQRDAAAAAAPGSPPANDLPDFTIGGIDAPPPEPAPVTPPPPKYGEASSLIRGMGESVGRIIGYVPDTANTIADVLPDWMDSGLVISKDGISFQSGSGYRKHSLSNILQDMFDNTDLGVGQNTGDMSRGSFTSTQDIKDEWNAGNKTAAGLKALKFGVEQGVVSLPDMIAIMGSLPLYTLGMAGNFAQARAQNDNRDKANMADLLIGTAGSVITSALERVGADAVLGKLMRAPKLSEAGKSRLRLWLESLFTETVTEAAQNPVQFISENIGTVNQGQITPQAIGEQAGFGALGGLGGAATIGGVAHAIGGHGTEQQRNEPTRPDQAAGPDTTTTPAGPATGPATAAPTSVARVPKPGDALIFKPHPDAPGAVVEVVKVDPAAQSALVAKVDPESGEAVTDENGDPLTFIATFDDLQLNLPPAGPAVAQPTVAQPTTVNTAAEAATAPPSMTSAEPTSDIVGQVKDMYRQGSTRRGVYLSPDTIEQLKKTGAYDKLLKVGVVSENFDGDGGTLITKSKRDMQEAVAAREGGQTDMQAIVGALTGAGIAKPKVANPVVVQRKDAAGAVVQQTLVAPDQVTAAVNAVSAQPGVTEVAHPNAVINERAQKAAAELTAAPPEGVAPAGPQEGAAAPEPAAPPVATPKAKTALAQLDSALEFAVNATKTTKGPNSYKMDVRGASQAIGSLAQALRTAINEAQRRGATPEDVAQAADAAKKAERLTEKDEGDFNKSRGVSERILRERLAELSDAVASLDQWKDKPLVTQPTVAAEKKPKAERVKKPVAPKPAEPVATTNVVTESVAKTKLAETKPEPIVEEKTYGPYEGAQPWQVAMRQRTDLPRVTTIPTDHVAVNDYEQGRLGEPSMVQVAPIGEVVAHIREDIKNGIVPEHPSFGTLNQAYGLFPDDIKKVQAALEGKTTKIGGKKKYVPPKKTETATQAAEAAGEQVTQPKVETVQLEPSAVTGQEEQIVTELLGASTSELATEVHLDKTGALRNVMQGILQALSNRGNWTGWFAAVTRGGVLDREARTALYSAIREYTYADQATLPSVRERILGMLTNIDGKTLPPKAIEAVFEAANVARAYTSLRENLAQMDAKAAEDTNAILEATTQSEFDTRDLGGTNKEGGKNPATMFIRRAGEIGRAREALMTRAMETLGSVAKKVRGYNRSNLHEALANLSKAARHNDWITGVIYKNLTEQHRGDPYSLTSHMLLDGLLNRVSLMPHNSNTIGLHRLITAIRRAIPNVPVEFYDAAMQPYGWTGDPLSKAGGRYFPEGLVQVAVDFGPDERMVVDDHLLSTILHESVHAGTLYELGRNPDGPLAKRLEAIRQDIINRAASKYGRDRVEAVLAYFDDRSNNPRPPYYNEFGRELYGLLNVHELAAETLSNPYFHGFVNSLDTSPTQSWYRRTVGSFLTAIRDLFGVSGERSGNLLSDLMVTTLRTLDSQRARQLRRDTFVSNTTDMLMRTLSIDHSLANDLAERAAYGANATTIKGVEVPAAPAKVLDSMGVNYSRYSSYDRYANYVYRNGPNFLAGELATMRSQSKTYRNRILGEAPRPAEALGRLKHQEELTTLSGPNTVEALAGMKAFMRSGVVDKIKDVVLGMPTFDHLIRRGARMFSNSTDATNPLVALKNIRDTRRSFANQLLELAERTVNGKWMKLSLTESEHLGDMLQNTTLWQIDPEKGLNQPKLLRNLSQKRWEAKVHEIEGAWSKLSENQKDIYRSVQRYFKTEYGRIRKAAMDLAIDLYGVDLTPQQKTLLYALKNADGAENIIGSGKSIDLADQNERFVKVVKDLIRISAIKGPYFPLMRKGKYVVEAAREGVLSYENGDPQRFALKEDAQAAADDIRNLAPRNTARVKADGDHFIVQYKVRDVSFHQTQNEAAAAANELRSRGFQLEGDVFTRKLEAIQSASMTEGLRELVNKAEQLTKSGTGTDAEKLAALHTIQTAFTQILAERAASASTQLKRQGVAGFKGREAHETFARRVRASSWHYANLKTSVGIQRALQRIRQFSRDATQGQLPPGMNAQDVVLARGRLLSEITHRMQVEAGELDNPNGSTVDYWLGHLGFVNFLATPSYTFVNSMQNVNVALPMVSGMYGLRGTRAMLRGMKTVAGPAFAKAMRGLVSKPGEVTSYDVYTAIADAVKDDPKYARFLESKDGQPSALQQLVDRGVINASYVQELTSIANNQNLLVAKGMEYLRLFPQGAELWNRISTALAVLDVTNGNVDKASDMVEQVHFQYSLENRPRYFRKIGGMRLPQALTMFKMYAAAMIQLTGSLTVDAVGRNKTPDTRARSAAALAGIIAAHTFSAGIVGGVMLEPLRLLWALWHTLFGDDDKYQDIDTSVQLWAKEVTGSEDAARMLSKGAWNALGVDLSGRMGLNHILLYNPPEGLDESSLAKFLVQTVGGPMGSYLLQTVGKVADDVQRGRPYDAIMDMVPARPFQDARAAWKLMNQGVTTRAGETVVPASEFDWLDAVGRVAGFRTTQEVKAQDQASTEFGYKTWRSTRTKQLINQFWNAYDSGDAAAKAEALAAISAFNKKNPGAQISSDALRQAKQQRRAGAKSRVGRGRNPDLNRLQNY